MEETDRVEEVRPRVRADGLKWRERDIEVGTTTREVVSNGLFQRVETELVFRNPNRRVLGGELEFPIPNGATVCGYALEVDGGLVPGVVVEKEAARVAFENEWRRGADPGLVEQVKGNVWRTRIYPLLPDRPRRARIEWIAPLEEPEDRVVVERDGADVFVGRRTADEVCATPGDRLTGLSHGWILWDASASRRDATAADRALLARLPEKGDWRLVVFRNVPEPAVRVTSRAELCDRIASAPCDGGTDLGALLAVLPDDGLPKALFTDGTDTLSERPPELERVPDLVVASRPPAPLCPVSVRKLAHGEVPPVPPAEGRLLATAWAAARVAELSGCADAHKDELLALGRAYGVASPVTSLLVLERLDQWLEYGIEPPAESGIHAEWVRLRAAQDDDIAAKEAAAEHERELLRLWKERVQWWNDPKPRPRTPRSGLFDSVREAVRSVGRTRREAVEAGAVDGGEPLVLSEEDILCQAAGPVLGTNGEIGGTDEAFCDGGARATVVLKAWDPDMPYLKALDRAKGGDAYATYLDLRVTYGTSPAFYLDCAGWFLARELRDPALRILSNLAELKVEDPALWRTMGWRLREAGAYDEAVRAFRHVLTLRGEEGQSFRDLALVLSERGRDRRSRADVEEAMALFVKAAFRPHARRAARRSNDLQVSVVALEELNGLIAWCAAQTWPDGVPTVPELDPAFRRDLPMALRIVLSWDADETDVDLHVLEPSGEEAYYGNRRTQSGGFVSEDVTTGYGPEEYLLKTAGRGTYRVLAHYYASHRQQLTGATTVTATVYTDWGSARETRRILTLRLDHPRDRHAIGDIAMD